MWPRQTPKTDLELDGEHGGESLDGEPLVRLLRNSATLLTGPIFNRDVFRLRKSVDAGQHVRPRQHQTKRLLNIRAPFKTSGE